MGQRLNIELTDGEKIIASCYFDDAAYSEEALDITERIIQSYTDIFGGSGFDLYLAVKLFESIGGGINGVERNRLSGNMSFDMLPAHSSYEGIISVTEKGIREARRWENGRITINLQNRTFDFHVHYYTYLEEYIEFTDRVPGCVEWEDLPRIDADADIFDGIYFDHLYMIRRVVRQCPNGLRLRNGDVIEWM